MILTFILYYFVSFAAATAHFRLDRHWPENIRETFAAKLYNPASSTGQNLDPLNGRISDISKVQSEGIAKGQTTEVQTGQTADISNIQTSNVKSPEAAAADSPLSGGKPMIQSINEFRKRADLPLQTWDSKLASNAAKTGNATGGKYMAHQMNPGTGGQVLVQGVDDEGKCQRNFGTYTPFELFYLSWLCEVPSAPGLDGQCPKILQMSRITSLGQTGHYKLLSSKSYKRIGCAFTKNTAASKCGFVTGIWACDLA